MIAANAKMRQRSGAAPLKSCIYEGLVTHRRSLKLDHSFRYRLFQVYLDLDELDRVFHGRMLWSTHRFTLARFRRDDHLGNPQLSLADAVRELVQTQTGEALLGPIRLLTNLRYYGFQMNPVSFYFCFDSTDSYVEAVVAEVHNTPWGEQYNYVLKWPDPSIRIANFRNDKVFHVSPFFPMDMQYRWQISMPGDSVSIQIQNYMNNEKAFDAVLSMRRHEITTWNLNSRLFKFPFMTGQVVAGIYWQALKLWWKGATYYPHPKSKNSDGIGEPLV